MATPAELRAIEEAHRAAQARLGLLAAYLVLRDWGSEEQGSITATAAGWISPALRVINAVRRKSVRLARRYYRLARAIETGSTLGLPDSMTEGTRIKLSVLRDEYVDVLNEISLLGTEATSTDPDEAFFEERLKDIDPDPDPEEGSRQELLDAVDLESYIQEWVDAQEQSDGKFIDVDEFDWDLDEEDLEALQKIFEKAIREDVIEAGDKRIQEIRQSTSKDDDPAKVIADLDAQRAASGSRAAGRIDRYGLSAGRDELARVLEQDTKVKLVARGLGPNPCGFCAMLASRGFVYGNKLKAMTSGDRDTIKRYHDNCHCYPIVRWVDASELPAANAWLQTKWYEVTAGTSGAQMRTVWRRWWDATGRKEYFELLGDALTSTQAA